MACKNFHDFHNHFPKIAEESGFTFNIHKPRMHIDWNKIRTIDIESIIRERNFFLIERHLNDILHCVLESEFDVRILDEGVLKMFRLSQLAVEYQQFCRHYLDRSVHVLREELTTLIQELDATKRDLREKEEELKKLRRKSKFNVKTQLPFGNDNIATMILKTLSNKSDIFPSASNVDVLQYNKCSYCDKVFLNQLYLKSHISRRHLNILEMPQKDVGDQIQNISLDRANSKLNEEITELKAKIKELENLITKSHNQSHPSNVPEIPVEKNTENSCRSPEDKIIENKNNNIEAKMKDADVSPNKEVYIIDKIEEWKKEEHDKYNKEINLLRTQILETINSFKVKDSQRSFENDSSIVEQLHTTIKQQGTEILSLKQELTNAKLLTEKEEIERRTVADAQISLWTKRVEAQSKQYESLLQKLNEVAKEASESRALAKAEQERAAQLQEMLHQAMNQKHPYFNERLTHHKRTNTQDNEISKSSKDSFNHQPNPVTDRKTLENLHRKAQELLNIGSSSSSEMSSASIEETKFTDETKFVDKKRPLPNGQTYNTNKKEKDSLPRGKKTTLKTTKITDKLHKQEPSQVIETKNLKMGYNNKSYSNNFEHIKSSPLRAPASPIKIIRAKLVEEVNSHLVSVGVDPLKCRLPQIIFQKQRIQLQQQNESKSKKNPDYQRVRHSIISYLDANVSDIHKETFEPQGYISPSKIAKAFSIGSVISNVKSKALSLVKSNDVSFKTKVLKNKTLNADVAKKAMTLLKTPPGSAPVSPVIQRKLIKINTKGLSSAKETKHNSKIAMLKKLPNKSTTAEYRTKLAKPIITTVSDSGDESNDSEHQYYNSAIIQDASKNIETLIRSPARRPSSANADYSSSIRKNTLDNDKLNLVRAQSTTNVNQPKVGAKDQNHPSHSSGDSSDDIESPNDVRHKKKISEENIQDVPKQTKGVLKNASSTSSLNKKKVLFDMDAIQMKSVSASPSHSTTEKSDANEKFALGLVNLDSEEWDISSIENEPLKNDTKIQNSRTSPKIAELKETIESQLARRRETPRTILVGGVDVLAGPIVRPSSIAGSNTSLGSSILDDSEGIPAVNHKAFVKPKRLTVKDDSELDISEYSIEITNNNKENDSF